jgi:hypothetical protein
VGFLATATSRIAFPKFLKSSTLETGSVSQAKATSLPFLPSLLTSIKTIPSAVAFPARAADTFCPFLRRISMAASNVSSAN